MSSNIIFDPLGGYPPFIRKDDTRPAKSSLESRGFSSANILKIQDFLEKNKNIPNSESSVGGSINDLIFNEPNEYTKISYKKI